MQALPGGVSNGHQPSPGEIGEQAAGKSTATIDNDMQAAASSIGASGKTPAKVADGQTTGNATGSASMTIKNAAAATNNNKEHTLTGSMTGQPLANLTIGQKASPSTAANIDQAVSEKDMLQGLASMSRAADQQASERASNPAEESTLAQPPGSLRSTPQAAQDGKLVDSQAPGMSKDDQVISGQSRYAEQAETVMTAAPAKVSTSSDSLNLAGRSAGDNSDLSSKPNGIYRPLRAPSMKLREDEKATRVSSTPLAPGYCISCC